MFFSVVKIASTAAILLSVVESAALPARSISERNLAGYVYDGCFTEADGQRAFTGNTYFDDLMTTEKCAAACSSYDSFGIEYGRECYCGNTRNTGSISAPESDCSFPCPGDSTKNCGAGNRLNVYTKSKALPTTYTAKGCISEPSNGRALAEKRVDGDDMTIAKCAEACTGYAYFGLEYYRECYCSNIIQDGSHELTNGECKFPCLGNPNETCGGDWALNLYKFEAIAPAVPQFFPDGCWTDSTSDRVLTGALFYDDGMTVAKCAAICSSFEVFGIEYGRECYCGNTLKETSTKRDDLECSFACPGDASQKCGAGDRLNVFRKTLPTVTSTTIVASTTSSSVSSSTSGVSSFTTTPITTSVSTTTSTESSSTTSESTTSELPSSTLSTTTTTNVVPSSTSSSSVSSMSSSTTLLTTTTTTTSTTSSTSSTTTTTTTTTTSAVPLPAPTQITKIITSPLNRILQASANGNYVQYNYDGGPGTDMGVIYTGGLPFIASDPSKKWVLGSPTPRYGVVALVTEAQIAASPNPIYTISCSVGADGILSCSTNFNAAFNTIYSCGAYMYFGLPTWVQSGCVAVKFKLVTTTYL